VKIMLPIVGTVVSMLNNFYSIASNRVNLSL